MKYARIIAESTLMKNNVAVIRNYLVYLGITELDGVELSKELYTRDALNAILSNTYKAKYNYRHMYSEGIFDDLNTRTIDTTSGITLDHESLIPGLYIFTGVSEELGFIEYNIHYIGNCDESELIANIDSGTEYRVMNTFLPMKDKCFLAGKNEINNYLTYISPTTLNYVIDF